ncbi:MAG: glycosyltransferase family 4 protein [Deltaproteobacteria bacterium]|nr:glycosyltransferase family 4 protein [Deltaproteobacteria bacterium]
MGKKIGFVSTRLAGTDGVSLEASKWSEVLENRGHSCYWLAGELDREETKSFLVPQAHFQDEENIWVNENIFGKKGRDVSVTDVIHALRTFLKRKIYEFVRQFNIDLIIVENALTIPMHIPLGLALTEYIAETRIPTIAHHHDFYWERTRFLINSGWDYIRMAFPPNLPSVRHVVINSAAQEELALRTGISSTVIPNVLDFDNPPLIDEKRAKEWRTDIGLKHDDIMILNPTRIIHRKGIEHAIELVRELKDSRYKLVISHEAGDEGFEYAEWITKNAREHGVDLRLFRARIADPLVSNANHQTAYSLWDIYPFADFITYPSSYEGFGNALLEAIYFKKPVLVNRYPIFVRDIEPKGFNLIIMDGFITGEIVQRVKNIMESSEKRERMVNRNYNIASRYYSYTRLREYLSALIINFFGAE